MKTLIEKAHPAKTTTITLGQDPYINALYGCFRFHNPKGDAFTTDRDVEIIVRSGKKIHVQVPATMRVDLPADTKVVNSDLYRIERIGKNLDSMHLLTMRAGWNQNDRDIQRMVGLDPKGSFVVHLRTPGADIPVATSSVLPLGRNNTWIGMILVHPELRRQGIANAMMQHCLKYAIDQGKIINGLDATPMGNTVYGAVGYVNSYRIWRSVFELAEFAETTYDTHHVKPIADADMDELIRYDATAFVERDAIMRALVTDGEGGCFVSRNDAGVIQGYCLTRAGRIRPFVGPFFADSEEIARNLLIAASRHLLKTPGNTTAFLDTPENRFDDKGVYMERVFDQENKPTHHRLSRTLKPVRDFTRMYQLVNYTSAPKLIKQFIEAEHLEPSSARVREFEATINQSVMNYSETLAFMTLERESLQHKYWGITGPEKG